MKQFKFFTAALALCMTLTSCLDSDNDYEQVNSAIAKVYDTMGNYLFKTADGYTISPSYSSVINCETNGFSLSELSGKVAYLMYTLEEAAIDEEKKTATNVTLKAGTSLQETTEIVNGTQEDQMLNDSVANCPIITLEYQNIIKPYFIDDTSIILPIQYNVKRNGNFFTLVYYTNEENVNEDTLRLHLRFHSIGTEMGTVTTSYNYLQAGYVGLFYKAYDLTNVYYSYLMKKGLPFTSDNYPKTIEIVTQESDFSTDLTASDVMEKIYLVNRTKESSN